MSGADSAGVAVGSFDREKIEAAADGQQQTPLGLPVTKSIYAGRTLFTAGEAGFAVLTAKRRDRQRHRMRRALDRIEEGRVRRSCRVHEKLLNTPGVARGGCRLHSIRSPTPHAKSSRFRNGVKTWPWSQLRAAGSIWGHAHVFGPGGRCARRPEPRDATLHARALRPFLALLGSGSAAKLRRTERTEVAFVIGVDGAAVAALLDKAQDLLLLR